MTQMNADKQLKALSVQQPWAWALFHGKPVENRDWAHPPKYRGPLLIHASKTFDQDGYEWLAENKESLGIDRLPEPAEFKRGGFIGIVEMVDVVTEHESSYFFGPLGFVFEKQRELEFYPFLGKLGLFDVPEGIVKL